MTRLFVDICPPRLFVLVVLMFFTFWGCRDEEIHEGPDPVDCIGVECTCSGDADCGPDSYCDGESSTCQARVCAPGETVCADGSVMECDARGTRYVVRQACGDLACVDGRCTCSGDDQCNPGEACIDGGCECASGVTCGSTRVCCGAEESCREQQVCDDGRCYGVFSCTPQCEGQRCGARGIHPYVERRIPASSIAVSDVAYVVRISISVARARACAFLANAGTWERPASASPIVTSATIAKARWGDVCSMSFPKRSPAEGTHNSMNSSPTCSGDGKAWSPTL